jgi:hypothetical protein
MLAKDPAIFIVPVLQFFGLPDYNFEPLRTSLFSQEYHESQATARTNLVQE